MESDVLTLEVISPEKMVLSTKASRIELPGTLGRFVVLKDHAPLISSLAKGEIVYTSEDKENRIAVSSGFVKVEENRIMACVEL
jgi:F-type H+-transporting ATPase subunit epsilon